MIITGQFKINNTQAYIIIILLTIIMFHVFYGLDVLVPTNINWLMSVRHDWGQHYLGWAFYRDEPWGFPLGNMDSILYPAGTNVGYWDSIPLLALFFKIFSFLLPETFQYLGIWLLFCYLMAAHYAFKIFKLYNVTNFFTIIAVLLIVGNPMLLYRGMHPALCAHGFILASVYFYLQPATDKNVKSINNKQLWLTVVSSLINPYICLMVIGFAFALPAKHYFYRKLLTLKETIVYPALSVVGVVLCWVVFGMITFGQNSNLEVNNSYGLYAFNYNSFFNSGGFSMFFPPMPWVNAFQYESYMYLGLGLMVFIAISLIYFLIVGKPVVFIKTHQWLLPLFILALLMGLFATTHIVTYNATVLLELPIPGFIKRLGGIFRASARFYWTVYYLVCLFFLVVFLKSRIPTWAKTTVLIIVAALQAYDGLPLYSLRHQVVSGDYDSPLDEAKWNMVLQHFDRMITYPPFNSHLLNGNDYQDLCLLALKNNQAIATGYSAREDGLAYKRYTDSLNMAISEGKLRKNELYITTNQYIDMFRGMIHNKQLTMQYLDGYYLLYTNNSKIPIADTRPEIKKVTDSLITAYAQSPFIGEIKTPASSYDKMTFDINDISIANNNIWVQGWAFLKERDNNKGDSVFATLNYRGKTLIAKTKQVKRPDITGAFSKTYLEDSGFSTTFPVIPSSFNEASLGIAIKKNDGGWTYADLGVLSRLNCNKKPTELKKLPPVGNLIGNFDVVNKQGNLLRLSGWAAFNGVSSTDTEIQVVFISNNIMYISDTGIVMRPDITERLGEKKYNYTSSGFALNINTTQIKAGEYTLGLIVKDKAGKQLFMQTASTTDIK